MNSVLESIEFLSNEAWNMLSINIPQIKSLISKGHTAIIVLVFIAILLSIVTIVRQQKLMKMIQELTPKATAQDLEKGDSDDV